MPLFGCEFFLSSRQHNTKRIVFCSFLLSLTLASTFVDADQFGSLSLSLTAKEIMLAVGTLQIELLEIVLLVVVLTTPAAAIMIHALANALQLKLIVKHLSR